MIKQAAEAAAMLRFVQFGRITILFRNILSVA
jgi:hypothetical protein